MRLINSVFSLFFLVFGAILLIILVNTSSGMNNAIGTFLFNSYSYMAYGIPVFYFWLFSLLFSEKSRLNRLIWPVLTIFPFIIFTVALRLHIWDGLHDTKIPLQLLFNIFGKMGTIYFLYGLGSFLLLVIYISYLIQNYIDKKKESYDINCTTKNTLNSSGTASSKSESARNSSSSSANSNTNNQDYIFQSPIYLREPERISERVSEREPEPEQDSSRNNARASAKEQTRDSFIDPSLEEDLPKQAPRKTLEDQDGGSESKKDIHVAKQSDFKPTINPAEEEDNFIIVFNKRTRNRTNVSLSANNSEIRNSAKDKTPKNIAENIPEKTQTNIQKTQAYTQANIQNNDITNDSPFDALKENKDAKSFDNKTPAIVNTIAPAITSAAATTAPTTNSPALANKSIELISKELPPTKQKEKILENINNHTLTLKYSDAVKENLKEKHSAKALQAGQELEVEEYTGDFDFINDQFIDEEELNQVHSSEAFYDDEDEEEDDDDDNSIIFQDLKKVEETKQTIDAHLPNKSLESRASQSQSKKRRAVYKIPIVGLLNPPDEQKQVDEEFINNTAKILELTLQEFNIEARVIDVCRGPVVTMFEILPAAGVRLRRIVELSDNIALRLAAPSVRIVAPIPGKEAVGIEVPNKDRDVVSFAELIADKKFNNRDYALPIALGKNISNKIQILDISRTPHLLIAGATGSGKSVCINAILCSLLYRCKPEEVRLILIDPKIVELSFYNGIGHLLTPVISEPAKSLQALRWCVKEMDQRYQRLESLNVREIRSYNQKLRDRGADPEELMPFIVVVIDEFADLMMICGKEIEILVSRLTAKSRAVGIHLVIATQRPSTDVITGLIKANIPARIAFMVTSKTDSRIILDMNGAENLLGRGDMLYSSSSDPFPERLQGPYLSEEEVQKIVEHVKNITGEPEYISNEIFITNEESNDSNENLAIDDPLWDAAVEEVIKVKKASASHLQRRLKIGYNRAARLVEEMEERGLIGPQQGSKPREVYSSET